MKIKSSDVVKSSRKGTFLKLYIKCDCGEIFDTIGKFNIYTYGINADIDYKFCPYCSKKIVWEEFENNKNELEVEDND